MFDDDHVTDHVQSTEWFLVFGGDNDHASRMYLEALALAPDADAIAARLVEMLPQLAP